MPILLGPLLLHLAEHTITMYMTHKTINLFYVAIGVKGFIPWYGSSKAVYFSIMID